MITDSSNNIAVLVFLQQVCAPIFIFHVNTSVADSPTQVLIVAPFCNAHGAAREIPTVHVMGISKKLL